jgi:hypothetical protein
MTTCGGHRRVGYSLNSNYEWVCRECGDTMDNHETIAQTVERLKREEAQA